MLCQLSALILFANNKYGCFKCNSADLLQHAPLMFQLYSLYIHQIKVKVLLVMTMTIICSYKVFVCLCFWYGTIVHLARTTSHSRIVLLRNCANYKHAVNFKSSCHRFCSKRVSYEYLATCTFLMRTGFRISSCRHACFGINSNLHNCNFDI